MIKKTTAFYVVLVGSLASFMAAYTSNAVTMALPELARVFHLSNILQNWTINLYLLTMAVLSVPFGKICAQKGLKKSFFYGALVFFIGTAGIIMAANTEMLLLFSPPEASPSRGGPRRQSHREYLLHGARRKACPPCRPSGAGT